MDPTHGQTSLHDLLHKWDLLHADTIPFSPEAWYVPFRRAFPLLTRYYHPLTRRTLYTWAHQDRHLSTLPAPFQELFSDQQRHSTTLWFSSYTSQQLPPKTFFFIPSHSLRADLHAQARAHALLVRPPHGALIQREQQRITQLLPCSTRRTQLAVLRNLQTLRSIPKRSVYKHYKPS